MHHKMWGFERLATFAVAVGLIFSFCGGSAFAASTYYDQYPAVGGTSAESMPRISVKVSDPAGITGGYQIKIDGASKTPKTKWGPGNAYLELYYQV
ncbi:MAG TPA: hypothetical protein VFG89_08940, partial [Coriobacteriia bacterium]|nr:hypothetical protein [Coriobacteriia bacterium]